MIVHCVYEAVLELCGCERRRKIKKADAVQHCPWCRRVETVII
jgi:hypothetical protein